MKTVPTDLRTAPRDARAARRALGWAAAAATALFVAGFLVGYESISRVPATLQDTAGAGQDHDGSFGAILVRNLGAAALLYSGVLTGGLLTGTSLALLSVYVGATAKIGVLNVGAAALAGAAGWYAGLEFLGCLVAAAAGLLPLTAALTARRHGLMRSYLTALPASLGVLALAATLLLAAAGIEAALIARR
ncbi:hypothetical protein [Kocuria rosea]|uniref:hypothetical protein n=1 Tax=Kocuria rosea TaxID=1275 RepID=UPI000E08C9DA|nr:hypothetical protein [Kocuria rosea]STX07826.1 Integral membrane protein DUF95 [Kocuria rosea]VEI50903.1 Integral membrane protein DUF95 [Kocuria rosea]